LIAPLKGVCEEPVRPPAGTNVDETRVVQLRKFNDEPCISITVGEAAILLQKAEIESLANAKPATWKSEDERIARINGLKAEELLSRLSSSPDSYGCLVAAKASLSNDATWLVLRQLELGAAALRLGGKYVSSVRIRYFGTKGDKFGIGSVSVSLPDGAGLLFVVLWWIT